MEVKRKDVWGLLLVLLLGQLVAFTLAASSFSSSLIANLGVDAPLTQSFFTYLLLISVYVPIVLYRRRKLQAYQYSYITSVTLLDCWTIVLIILTWYALGTRYSFWQFVGAGTCVAGLVLLSNAKATDEQDIFFCCNVSVLNVARSNSGCFMHIKVLQSSIQEKIPLLGDALVIAGTVCYAFSNVGEEYCIKKKDQQVEVVAMLGFFGLLVSTVQIGLFAVYALAFSVFYTVTPYVLKNSGSTLFNLSLLTSDMWAIAIRVVFYRQQINWLYYLAFGVVAIGLIIYSLNESSLDDERAASTEAAAQYQQLQREDNSEGSGSNSGIQERALKEEVHIC
ncbi:hypothetical protein SETIT_3G224400v2 [Setaria italica]|uniref:Uncharacterized protein n=1 Tax=Setaria italica TaxID=4555 RepID=A0A368QHN8_SETIT|nr:hypothetical protein SETIT_3G224400v2 [Setaria italica]